MHQPAMFFIWLCTLCGSCWERKDVHCPFGVRPFTSSLGGRKKKKKSENICSMLHGFLWAVGKRATGLVWKQGEDESWRLPTYPHPPNLIVCIKIGVSIWSPQSLPPPTFCIYFLSADWIKLWLSWRKWRRKKDEKDGLLCWDLLCGSPTPLQLPGVVPAAFSLTGCCLQKQPCRIWGGRVGAQMCPLAVWERC